MMTLHVTQQLLTLVPGQTEERITDVAQQFQGGGSELSGTVVLAVAIVCAVAGVACWQVSRMMAMRDGRSYYSPQRLFRELCRLHELDFASRRLLRRLAKARGLRHPARLFLEPALFDVGEAPGPLRSKQTRLIEIRHRLFPN